MGAPVKMTVSQGQPVKLNCSVEGMEDPDIHWMKDNTVVQNASQVSISISEQNWIGLLSLKSVERSDAGLYWCQVKDGEETKVSQSVRLTVEGEKGSTSCVCHSAKTYTSTEENSLQAVSCGLCSWAVVLKLPNAATL